MDNFNGMIKAATRSEKMLLDKVPDNINDSEILHILYNTDINWKYANALKNVTQFNDGEISDWLNISVKTFREYKKPKSTFKENVSEQILLLLSLFKQGREVFGTGKDFENWLNQENFYFDNKKPVFFLTTITGIKFIADRLTSMEYGDNI